MIVEMSETGLSFVSGRSTRTGEELTIAWQLDPAQSPLQIRCMVRHISHLAGQDGLQVGAEFLNLPLAERLAIMEFLTRRVHDTSPARPMTLQ